MYQPVAVVRIAGMTTAVASADPAACPALPWQASIERRIADSARGADVSVIAGERTPIIQFRVSGTRPPIAFTWRPQRRPQRF